jgi:DNA-binding NarL/FixJ family response regulator
MTATVPTVAEPTYRSNRPPTTRALIRVAVLDDHVAVRAGLEAIVGSASGIVSIGSAHDEAGLEWLLQRADPSVLILDVHHPGLHGLALSVRLKRRSMRPRIVLYSGRGGELLKVAAAVAGVDAVVAKSDQGQVRAAKAKLASRGNE